MGATAHTATDRNAAGRFGRGSLLLLLALVLPAVLAGGLGLTRELLDQVRTRYGWSAYQRVLDWRELMDDYRDRDIPHQLQAVNRFFNEIRFLDDQEHWRQRDYWATPLEFLATNGGDCEDYSIAKYFTLRELGIPEDSLRITYVKALELDQAHMVLAYYPQPDAEPLILDNLKDKILPAAEREDLVPVYTFNGKGLWLSVERGRGRQLGGGNGMGRWKELMLRMRKDFGDDVVQPPGAEGDKS